MTKPETIKALEKKYHVHIDKDYYTGPYYDTQLKESFKIYSMDGCKWDNVNGYRSLVKTLAEDREALLKIAQSHKVTLMCERKKLATLFKDEVEDYMELNGLDWVNKFGNIWEVEHAM